MVPKVWIQREIKLVGKLSASKSELRGSIPLFPAKRLTDMLGFPVEIHMEDTMYRGYTIHPLRDGGFRIIAETYVVRNYVRTEDKAKSVIDGLFIK